MKTDNQVNVLVGAVHCTIKLRSAVRGPSLDFATWPNKLRKHNGLVREPPLPSQLIWGNLVCHIGFSISAFRGEFVDILSYPVPAECSWHFLTRILPASFSDLSPGVKLSIEFVWSSNNSDNEEKGKNGQLDSPQSLYYSFLRNQPIMSQPYIQKGGSRGSRTPQTILNFPQKDCLSTRKVSRLHCLQSYWLPFPLFMFSHCLTCQ